MKDIREYINESVFDKDLIKRAPEKVKLDDIEDRDTALAYIIQNYKTEPAESGWGKGGQAIKIIYNPRLSMRIDFLNRREFVYTIYGPNDEEIYDLRSTREADRADWDKLLDIRKFAANFKSIRANFGRNKAHVDWLHKVADKIYDLI